MSDVNKKVQIELVAKDNTKAAFESAAKGATNARMSFKELVGGVALGQAAFTAVAGAITTATRAIGGFIKDSATTAMEMERINQVLPVVAGNTGKTTEEINRLIFAIREEGKSMLEAKSITLELARAQMGEKEALQLITAARDLAATAGVSSNDANKAILQSINQLTPAYLQQLGIQVSLRVAYDDYATSIGKATSELTTVEKQQAIFNATMKEAEKVAGAYDASLGASSKLLNSLKDAFETTKLAIGEMITGAAFPLIQATYGSIKAFNNWAYTSNNELNPSLKAVQEFITGNVLGTFASLKGATDFVRESYTRLVEWLEKIGIIDAFRNAWERIVKVYNEELKPAVDDLLLALEPYMPLLGDIAKMIATVLVGALILFLEMLTSILVNVTRGIALVTEMSTVFLNTFAPAIDMSRAMVQKLGEMIEWLIKKFQDAVAAARAAADAIRNAFSSAVSAVGSALGGTASASSNYFRDKIPAMASGGIVTRPTLALVGEAGPEAVIPLNKAGGFGGINILQGATINVSGEADEDRLISKIAAELARTTQAQRNGMATAY